jgi:hypothetical protein
MAIVIGAVFGVGRVPWRVHTVRRKFDPIAPGRLDWERETFRQRAGVVA